jgi:hypothetical protein
MKIGKILLILLVSVFVISIAWGEPTGANLTRGASSRGANKSSIQTQAAEAGNVTSLDVNQSLITGIWQGFFGDVTGDLVLENALGNNFYDWSYGTIEGEIFATRTLVTDWTTVNCTNVTHWEAEESALNIESTDVDGINETYSATDHPSFTVGAEPISGCPTAQPYNSSSLEEWWNALITVDTNNVVYTAIIADNGDAFDGTTVDFEILVPVDEDTRTATYYFYAELE